MKQKHTIVQYHFFRCIQYNQATIEIIAEYLSSGASLEATNYHGDNVFHIGAQYGAIESLQALIDYMKKDTPAESSSKSLLVWLDHKMFSDDPELPTATLQLLKAKNKIGFTPLHLAALGGHNDCVRFLLTKASTHAFRDNKDRTPLTCAAQQGHLSTVQLLEENFSALHFEKDVCKQPIHWAASSGNDSLVIFMLKRRVPLFVLDKKGRLPSYYAAKNGNVNLLHLFRKLGDKLDGKHPHQFSFFQLGFETPIKSAAKKGQHRTLYYLTQLGADVTQVDTKGLPPIHHAAAANQTRSIEILVENGADFQSLTYDGQLPISRVVDYRWKQQFWKQHGMSACRETYLHAMLCYMSSFSHPTDRKTLIDRPEEKIFIAAERQIAAQRWKRFTDCVEMSATDPILSKAIEDHHYYGIIYYREINGSIEFVIAHRGTDLTSTPNLVADGQIMGREMPKLFIEATLPFLQQFVSQITTSQGLIYNHKPVSSITHVGFSLGGFLAAAAIVKMSTPNTFAKTFDAPGIDFLVNRDEEKRFAPRITNIVALPNLVNACNRHIGSIFQLSCIPVNDNQDQQHDVVFEVPSKVLIAHFFETLRRHDLKQIIETNFKRQSVFLRAVRTWPQAKIELVFGPHPKQSNYSIGLFNAVQNLVKGVLTSKVWNAMQRQTADGQMEGLIAVKHSCDYRVDYLNTGYVSPQNSSGYEPYQPSAHW